MTSFGNLSSRKDLKLLYKLLRDQPDKFPHIVSEFFSLKSYPNEWPLAYSKSKLSAVLVPLFIEEKAVKILLTKRNAALRRHGGQVAFPGGIKEQEETPVQTALRECEEELGLPASRSKILGIARPIYTYSKKNLVVPAVGVIDNMEISLLKPQPSEVSKVFSVDLISFLDANNHEVKGALGFGDSSLHFFHVQSETVWGATALIIWDLLEALDSHLAS